MARRQCEQEPCILACEIFYYKHVWISIRRTDLMDKSSVCLEMPLNLGVSLKDLLIHIINLLCPWINPLLLRSLRHLVTFGQDLWWLPLDDTMVRIFWRCFYTWGRWRVTGTCTSRCQPTPTSLRCLRGSSTTGLSRAKRAMFLMSCLLSKVLQCITNLVFVCTSYVLL